MPDDDAAGPLAFDAHRAFALLERQVACGPRLPGSPGHAACRQLLVEELTPYARSVEVQPFTASTKFGGPFELCNVIGLFGEPSAAAPLMLCAHWDTRPVCDRDPNPEHRALPCPGANDGASGVAVLLELARLFSTTPPPVPIAIACWDGEDSGGTSGARYGGYLLGSQHFVRTAPPHLMPDAVILLDMVAQDDRLNPRLGQTGAAPGLRLPMELNSLSCAPDLVQAVFATAHDLGHPAFVPELGPEIVDDHVPFQAVGVPAIDLVDWGYAERHTMDDTPAHCSAEALHQVGDTLRAFVYGLGPGGRWHLPAVRGPLARPLHLLHAFRTRVHRRLLRRRRQALRQRERPSA